MISPPPYSNELTFFLLYLDVYTLTSDHHNIIMLLWYRTHCFLLIGVVSLTYHNAYIVGPILFNIVDSCGWYYENILVSM